LHFVLLALPFVAAVAVTNPAFLRPAPKTNITFQILNISFAFLELQ
jgi:hypothetical protein